MSELIDLCICDRNDTGSHSYLSIHNSYGNVSSASSQMFEHYLTSLSLKVVDLVLAFDSTCNIGIGIVNTGLMQKMKIEDTTRGKRNRTTNKQRQANSNNNHVNSSCVSVHLVKVFPRSCWMKSDLSVISINLVIHFIWWWCLVAKLDILILVGIDAIRFNW